MAGGEAAQGEGTQLVIAQIAMPSVLIPAEPDLTCLNKIDVHGFRSAGQIWQSFKSVLQIPEEFVDLVLQT